MKRIRNADDFDVNERKNTKTEYTSAIEGNQFKSNSNTDHGTNDSNSDDGVKTSVQWVPQCVSSSSCTAGKADFW